MNDWLKLRFECCSLHEQLEIFSNRTEGLYLLHTSDGQEEIWPPGPESKESSKNVRRNQKPKSGELRNSCRVSRSGVGGVHVESMMTNKSGAFVGDWKKGYVWLYRCYHPFWKCYKLLAPAAAPFRFLRECPPYEWPCLQSEHYHSSILILGASSLSAFGISFFLSLGPKGFSVIHLSP